MKVSCVICPNKQMSAKGKPTQYLGHCEYFKNQSLIKQKELLKSNKICFVCLAPMKDCRKDPDFKTCSKQTAWNLKCRHCGDLRHQKHVTWDLTNANFMSQPDPESLRTQFNIPKEGKINTYYVGESPDSDIVNAFSSQKTPQRLKAHIQCVSQVELRLAATKPSRPQHSWILDLS